MLLKNIIKYKLPSSLVGMPKLDNFYIIKKLKKAKPMKVRKGFYGGVGGPYSGEDGGND